MNNEYDELRAKLADEIIECVRLDENPSDEVGAKLLYFLRGVVERETAQQAATIAQLTERLATAEKALAERTTQFEAVSLHCDRLNDDILAQMNRAETVESQLATALAQLKEVTGFHHETFFKWWTSLSNEEMDRALSCASVDVANLAFNAGRASAESALAAKTRELEEIAEDKARLDWLGDNPEHTPYLDDGIWRIPYLSTGAGGFGGGVSTFNDRALRGVIDTARSTLPAGQKSLNPPVKPECCTDAEWREILGSADHAARSAPPAEQKAL